MAARVFYQLFNHPERVLDVIQFPEGTDACAKPRAKLGTEMDVHNQERVAMATLVAVHDRLALAVYFVTHV